MNRSRPSTYGLLKTARRSSQPVENSKETKSQKVFVVASECALIPKDVVHVRVEESVTRIRQEMFAYRKDLKRIELPKTLERIEESAFFSCAGLEEITLPKSLLFLGKHVFGRCSSLKYLELPESIIELADGVCQHCSSLREIHLHDNIRVISPLAFHLCISLESAQLPANLEKIGYHAFKDCKALRQIISSPSAAGTWKCLEESAFQGCLNLETADLSGGSRLVELPAGTFAECKRLRKAILPDGIKRIHANAFAECESLSLLNLPAALDTIDGGAFHNCSKLEALRLSKALQSVTWGAFRGCFNLKAVYIPDDIAEIAVFFFVTCPNLQRIALPRSIMECSLPGISHQLRWAEAYMILSQAGYGHPPFWQRSVPTIVVGEPLPVSKTEYIRFFLRIQDLAWTTQPAISTTTINSTTRTSILASTSEEQDLISEVEMEKEAKHAKHLNALYMLFRSDPVRALIPLLL